MPNPVLKGATNETTWTFRAADQQHAAIGRNLDIKSVRSNVTCNGPTQFMGVVLPIRPGGAWTPSNATRLRGSIVPGLEKTLILD
jgi:hypothetical protein